MHQTLENVPWYFLHFRIAVFKVSFQLWRTSLGIFPPHQAPGKLKKRYVLRQLSIWQHILFNVIEKLRWQEDEKRGRPKKSKIES